MTIPLPKQIYKLTAYVTGTVRRNRKFLPQACRSKFEVFEKKYFRRDSVLNAAFREEKSQRLPVVRLSTYSKAIDSERVHVRHGQQKQVESRSVK